MCEAKQSRTNTSLRGRAKLTLVLSLFTPNQLTEFGELCRIGGLDEATDIDDMVKLACWLLTGVYNDAGLNVLMRKKEGEG